MRISRLAPSRADVLRQLFVQHGVIAPVPERAAVVPGHAEQHRGARQVDARSCPARSAGRARSLRRAARQQQIRIGRAQRHHVVRREAGVLDAVGPIQLAKGLPAKIGVGRLDVARPACAARASSWTGRRRATRSHARARTGAGPGVAWASGCPRSGSPERTRRSRRSVARSLPVEQAGPEAAAAAQTGSSWYRSGSSSATSTSTPGCRGQVAARAWLSA